MEGYEKPHIAIFWDEEGQDIVLHFDPQHVKKLEFAMAILDMAKKRCEQMIEVARINAVREQMTRQANGVQLASNIERRIHER